MTPTPQDAIRALRADLDLTDCVLLIAGWKRDFVDLEAKQTTVESNYVASFRSLSLKVQEAMGELFFSQPTHFVP